MPELDKSHPIPFAALDGKVGIMGLTGSGKTYTAIGLAEQLLDAGRQVIIVDPTGVYNGLRTEFALPIFGGRYGDVEIGEESGDAVARLIIDRDLSAIVDVSLLLKRSHAAARRFMGPFVAALKNAPTRARYIVMDEADEFMPENASGDVTRLFGDLKWIVRRGRSEGWRMLMVTQRPQDIAKSVLTQCETMVIHRLTAPQDRKALLEWVKGNADAEQAKAVLDSMARLGTGEAWVWSPAHNLLERVIMPPNRSEDRSKTPDANDAPRARQEFKTIDLDGIRAALVSASPSQDLVAVTAPAKFTDHTQCEARIAALMSEKTALSRMITTFTENQKLLNDQSRSIRDAVIELGARLKRSFEPIAERAVSKPRVEPAEKPKPQNTAEQDMPTTKASPAAVALADLLDRVNPAKLSWSQACTMTGRKASGGNFNAARKWLRESGRIVEEGDLIWSAADAPAGLSSVEAFNLWHSILTNPAPRMMVVLQSGPKSRDELGEALGCVPRGGNWNSGVAQLRRNGVVTDQGGYLALSNPLPGAAK